MSNRRIRSIIGPSLSIHELRRLALGEDIVRWCDQVEPGMREDWTAIQQQAARVMGELRADIDRLVLMPTDTAEERAERDTMMGAVQERLERQTAIMERQARTYQHLSAGGAASIWSAMQRGSARKQQDDQPSERPVKPYRKFGDVHKLKDGTQPVDAEVVDAESD